MSRLWIYKCNARNLEYQRSWGDWNEFFDQPGDGEWGGTWCTSKKRLFTEMEPGDLVLAYQTNQQAVVGLCRVRELRRRKDGEFGLYLDPVQSFEPAVEIHKLKHKYPALMRAQALRSTFALMRAAGGRGAGF